MKTRTKLIILRLLGGIFWCVFIGASFAAIYFLYGTLAYDAPWPHLLWSIGIAFIAKQISDVLNDNKQRVDYVDQLMERGYAQGEAVEAWHTANSGGLNLLRNLQQAELSDEIDRLEGSINTPSAKGNSA
jgi:hypothetical protein